MFVYAIEIQLSLLHGVDQVEGLDGSRAVGSILGILPVAGRGIYAGP